MSVLLRRLIVLMAFIVPAPPADLVDDELARYNDILTRLERSYQEGLARERTRTVPALVAIARREAGDPAAAVQAWKLVLALDPDHDEARKALLALGKLESAIAELRARSGLLIGKGETTSAKPAPDPRLDMTGARVIRIQSQLRQGTGLGNHKAGSTLVIQYVSGAWSSQAVGKPQNPDAPNIFPGNRIELIEDTGNEPTVLATVPAGTADTPFVFVLEKNMVGLTLRIKNQDGRGRTYNGEVQYRFKVLPPAR